MGKVAAILLVAVAACKPLPEPDDDAKVWRTAIAAEIPHAMHGKNVVLERRTGVSSLPLSTATIVNPFRVKKLDVPEQLVTRFMAVNQSSVDLFEAFGRDNRITLVTSAAVGEMFRSSDLDADWAAFYAKYEGAAGLFKVSRPAFYRDLALLYVELSCGGLCGEGHFLLLRRAQGTWVVQADVLTWIS
jgi:hypothetical protein